MGKYFIAKNNNQSGPLSLEEIVSLLGCAKLMLTDFIFDSSQNEWVMLMSHNDLTFYLESLKPNLPPPNLDSLANIGSEKKLTQQSTETLEVNELAPLKVNDEYKKNLIDEVRNELSNSNVVNMSNFSDENISGPVTPSNFNDLIDVDHDESDKTQDIPIEIDDPTQEIFVDAVESHDRTESKINESLKALGEPLPQSTAEELEVPSLSFDNIKSSAIDPLEEPMLGANDKNLSAEDDIKVESIVSAEKQESLKSEKSSESNLIAQATGVPDIPMSKAFDAVEDNIYNEKIEEIKKGKGSLKEKALKISKALEEVADPIMSEWYVLKDHNKYGPYTYKDMLNMLEEKFVYGFDFVWHKSLSNWRRLEGLEAFSEETKTRLKDTFMPELTKVYHKRRHKRVNFGHSIMIHDNTKVWKGESVEIGEGGVGVVMGQAHIIPGQTLYLHFKPGDGVPPFNAACEVVSKKPQQNLETKKLEVLYGMRFLNISSDVNHLVSSIGKNKKTS